MKKSEEEISEEDEGTVSAERNSCSIITSSFSAASQASISPFADSVCFIIVKCEKLEKTEK